MTEKEFIALAAGVAEVDPAGIGMDRLIVADLGLNSLSLLLLFLQVEKAADKKILPLPYTDLSRVRLGDLWNMICEQREEKT